MNILYLHGLESKLNPGKGAILEQFGTVNAPELDYYSNPNIFALLIKSTQEQEINAVVGSSMGGFMGYFIANAINRPALLFNPALPYRSVAQNVPELNLTNKAPLINFVLGGQDAIVKANDNLKWISENRNTGTDMTVALYSQMKHQIPLDIFAMEVGSFFKRLCY